MSSIDMYSTRASHADLCHIELDHCDYFANGWTQKNTTCDKVIAIMFEKS